MENFAKKLNISIIPGGKSSKNINEVIEQETMNDDIKNILENGSSLEMIIHLSRLDNSVFEEMGVTEISFDKLNEEMDVFDKSRTTVEVCDGVYCHFYGRSFNDKKNEMLTQYVYPVIENMYDTFTASKTVATTFDGNYHFHCIQTGYDTYKFTSYVSIKDEKMNDYFGKAMRPMFLLFSNLSKSSVIKNPRIILTDSHFTEEEHTYIYAYEFDVDTTVSINKK